MAEAVHRFAIDTLVVGSDQVWRLEYAPDEEAKADFFLGFAPSAAVRKVSYAASFGRADWTYPAQTVQSKTLLAQFTAVSVREASGIDICETVFDRHDVRHVIDPTLLVDPSFYHLIASPKRRAAGKILLNYVLDAHYKGAEISRELQDTLGFDYVMRELKLDAGCTVLSIPEWVQAFMEADFVVTDSFHGMVFAIIFRKNFVAITNHGRGADRFSSLLKLLKLEDRLVSDPSPERLHELACQQIEYEKVEEKLESLKIASRKFLEISICDSKDNDAKSYSCVEK